VGAQGRSKCRGPYQQQQIWAVNVLLLLFLIIYIRDFRETHMLIKSADSLSPFLKSGPGLILKTEQSVINTAGISKLTASRLDRFIFKSRDTN
jgi:hypothetical protein